MLAESFLFHALVICEQATLTLVVILPVRRQVLLRVRADTSPRTTLLKYAIISISSFLLLPQHLLIPVVYEALESFLDEGDGPLNVPFDDLDLHGFELHSLLPQLHFFVSPLLHRLTLLICLHRQLVTRFDSRLAPHGPVDNIM